MQPDDHVCLCFHVSLRKLRAFMRSERPTVASQLSECMGAGTGCHWCVPFLEELHCQWENGEPAPDLPFDPETYAQQRSTYRQTGERGLKPSEDG